MCDPRDRPTPGPSPIVSSTPPPPAPATDGDATPGAIAPDPAADRMLEAARRGSNRAFAALVDRLDPECRTFAHVVLGGHAVDAALLGAYARAYRARRTTTEAAPVFLLHHVWIACGHEIRRRQRRQAPAPGRRAVRDDRRPRLGDDPVGRAVAALRPEERAVWVLTERGGLEPDTVAEALGVDPRIVATVAARVRAHVEAAVADPSTLDRLPPVVEPEDDEDVEDIENVEPVVEPADDEDGTAGDVVDTPDAGVGITDSTAPAGPVEAAATAGEDPATPAPEPPDDAADPTAVSDPTAGADPDATMALEAAALDADADEGSEEGPGSLDAAAAAPEFWAELGRRLRAEREALPAAPRPRLPEPGDPSPSLSPAKDPPVAIQKRAPRRARRHRPDGVDQLVGEADRQRPPRRWAALAVRVAAVVVVAAVFGAVVAGLYRAASNSKSPVRGDSVADVSRRSMLVLDGAGVWSASVELTSLGEDNRTRRQTIEIVAATDGSYRAQDSSIGRLTTYDAPFAVVMDSIPGLPPRHDTGVAPGPPDPTAPYEGMPTDDLAVAARTLAAVEDRAPTTESLNGREVLTLTGPLTSDIDLTYVVDGTSLTPVRISWTVDGTTVRELRFADVQLGVPDPSFTQELPDVAARDQGFAPVRLTEVAARTGMRTLTPDYLPEGFTFTGASVNEGARISSLRYARGPQELIVTLRPSPVEAGAVWDDPFERGDVEVTPTDLPIESGPFRGVTAQQVSGGTALPSVWGADGEEAFTVAGDVTAAELARIAQSLRQA